MNRNIKTLTKILMIILIAVSILLLLPKTVSALSMSAEEKNAPIIHSSTGENYSLNQLLGNTGTRKSTS